MVPCFHAQIEMVPCLHEQIQMVPCLHAQIEMVPCLRAQIEMVPCLHAQIEMVPCLHTQIEMVPGAKESWIFLSCMEVLKKCEQFSKHGKMDVYSLHTASLWDYARTKVSLVDYV